MRALTLVAPRISVSRQKVKLDDYRYDDLNVNNDLDNQLTASRWSSFVLEYYDDIRGPVVPSLMQS